MWEKSYGKGEALFLKSSSDSGLISCGTISGMPYFMRLNKSRVLNVDYTGENPGLLSSVWYDTSGYISAGSNNGKMLLLRNSPKGNLLWEKSIEAGYKLDYTKLFYTGRGNFLAVGTASPDSSDGGSTGILFVRFDTLGTVLEKKKTDSTSFVSANDFAIDDNGNIYVALTRKTTGSKTRASVAMYNDLFQKIWETELYNNPDFGAASIGINLDPSGNIYVCGKTELPAEEETLNNSFVVSLSSSGSLIWKQYLESSNIGSSMIFDEMGDLLLLNRNCFIINVLSSSDGSDAGRIRMFSVCDPYNTGVFGRDIDLSYDKNILIAGSRGGNFYLALKSSLY